MYRSWLPSFPLRRLEQMKAPHVGSAVLGRPPDAWSRTARHPGGTVARRAGYRLPATSGGRPGRDVEVDAMAKRRGSGEGSIYREGTRWVAKVTVEVPGGRQVRRKRSARTQQEARDALRDLRREAAAGVAGAKGATVAQFLADWLTHVLPARGVAHVTVVNYETVLRVHVIPALGTVRLDKLRPEHVDGLLRTMAETGKARNTIMRARAVLMMALTHAERRDLVLRNVARLAIVPPAPKRETRSLTADEARRLLDAARGDRLEAAFVVMLGLTWSSIDLDARRVTVSHALRREPGRLYLVNPKTRKSRRTLDLPGPVVDALIAHAAAQAAERVEAGELWEDHDLVFPSARGTLTDPNNFRRSFGKVAARAGLDDLRPHLLRHTAISLLSAAGVPLEQVADVAGHATTAMTEGVYRHPVAESVSAHVKVIEDLFGPGETGSGRPPAG